MTIMWIVKYEMYYIPNCRPVWDPDEQEFDTLEKAQEFARKLVEETRATTNDADAKYHRYRNVRIVKQETVETFLD